MSEDRKGTKRLAKSPRIKNICGRQLFSGAGGRTKFFFSLPLLPLPFMRLRLHPKSFSASGLEMDNRHHSAKDDINLKKTFSFDKQDRKLGAEL
jgi:hypothetical protein